MFSFLRRRETPSQKRGTLTLLPDDRFVLGLPDDVTDETVHGVMEAMRAWQDRGFPSSVIFPFPVDVDDRRGQELPVRLDYPATYSMARHLERIAKAVEHIDRKMVRRRPRIVDCIHPELHPEIADQLPVDA